MSDEAKIVALFPKLKKTQVTRLLAFFERDNLQVKGTDSSSKQPYRSGCLPYVGLVAAGFFGFVGEVVDAAAAVAELAAARRLHRDSRVRGLLRVRPRLGHAVVGASQQRVALDAIGL